MDLDFFYLGKPNGDDEDGQPIMVNQIQDNSEDTLPKFPHLSPPPPSTTCLSQTDLKLFLENHEKPYIFLEDTPTFTLWREGPLRTQNDGGLGWCAREDIIDLQELHDPT